MKVIGSFRRDTHLDGSPMGPARSGGYGDDLGLSARVGVAETLRRHGESGKVLASTRGAVWHQDTHQVTQVILMLSSHALWVLGLNGTVRSRIAYPMVKGLTRYSAPPMIGVEAAASSAAVNTRTTYFHCTKAQSFVEALLGHLHVHIPCTVRKTLEGFAVDETQHHVSKTEETRHHYAFKMSSKAKVCGVEEGEDHGLVPVELPAAITRIPPGLHQPLFFAQYSSVVSPDGAEMPSLVVVTAAELRVHEVARGAVMGDGAVTSLADVTAVLQSSQPRGLMAVRTKAGYDRALLTEDHEDLVRVLKAAALAAFGVDVGVETWDVGPFRPEMCDNGVLTADGYHLCLKPNAGWEDRTHQRTAVFVPDVPEVHSTDVSPAASPQGSPRLDDDPDADPVGDLLGQRTPASQEHISPGPARRGAVSPYRPDTPRGADAAKPPAFTSPRGRLMGGPGRPSPLSPRREWESDPPTPPQPKPTKQRPIDRHAQASEGGSSSAASFPSPSPRAAAAGRRLPPPLVPPRQVEAPVENPAAHPPAEPRERRDFARGKGREEEQQPPSAEGVGGGDDALPCSDLGGFVKLFAGMKGEGDGGPSSPEAPGSPPKLVVYRAGSLPAPPMLLDDGLVELREADSGSESGRPSRDSTPPPSEPPPDAAAADDPYSRSVEAPAVPHDEGGASALGGSPSPPQSPVPPSALTSPSKFPVRVDAQEAWGSPAQRPASLSPKYPQFEAPEEAEGPPLSPTAAARKLATAKAAAPRGGGGGGGMACTVRGPDGEDMGFAGYCYSPKSVEQRQVEADFAAAVAAAAEGLRPELRAAGQLADLRTGGRQEYSCAGPAFFARGLIASWRGRELHYRDSTCYYEQGEGKVVILFRMDEVCRIRPRAEIPPTARPPPSHVKASAMISVECHSRHNAFNRTWCHLAFHSPYDHQEWAGTLSASFAATRAEYYSRVVEAPLDGAAPPPSGYTSPPALTLTSPPAF
eukprot:TRINITY_DN2673_c0_g1_i1.p1 TRINITY_DN2673_c0_g1~~TRINITY_DN2673_c0_g1_i1.p1  ORF type:complete len:978 (+),score=304.14 TRINITY_DN2673_c0_g1_i1:107-3040(+)